MPGAIRINDEAAFKALKETPFIAWPTLLLMLLGYVTTLAIWYLCLHDMIPLWQGTLLAGLSFYLQFSPAHDSMHRAMSSNERLNSLLLFVSVQLASPGSTGRAFRILHMQHHRFANEHVNDPDHAIASNWKNAFSTWFFWDLLYLVYFLRNRQLLPAQARRLVWIDIVLNFSVLAVLFTLLPAKLLLMLWFIPARLSAWLICYTFMYLPHYPHESTHKAEPYRATTIRQGHEWLLSPLLVCQNYHLVHHLYPTVPFYRYRRVWLARKDFHEAQNPAIVPAFGLTRHTQKEPRLT